MTEINIDYDLLRAEAKAIGRVADSVDQGIAAVQSINLAGGAFGVMCAFIVPYAAVATSVALQAFTDTAEMLRREADALDAVAQDFEALETQTGKDLTRMAPTG